MKIQTLKSQGIPVMNIQYDGMRHKSKNKTFKAGNYLALLNFAVSLPDQYIMACEEEVRQWAVKNNHDVLRMKSWEFC
jgi:hypothetical protein